MFDHKKVEIKWEKRWEKEKVYKTDTSDFSKPKYYILDMFPYPSAVGLHVGHVEGYTATDALSRMKRMQGYNVLHPIGYDAFGLPAEQFAIKNNKNPKIYTDQNIENFQKQLKRLGFSYDWDRVVKTSDPKYYKWTQTIFNMLYDQGLAYEDYRAVNYCPKLGTVLANEEVIDGKSERGGYPVEKRLMKQWVLKITAYAEELLEGLSTIEWPQSTIAMQKNWIGKSKGVVITFKVKDNDTKFDVYTTRVDTLYGCTYVVLAPEHELVKKLVSKEQKKEVEQYIKETNKKSDIERNDTSKEKTGVFLGCYAINPINGEEVPIYIGDYVLSSYGCGAVMAVPAHDQRDYEFAKKHNLKIKQVLEGDISKHAFEDDGVHINSEEANGLNIADAKAKITEKLISLKAGRYQTNYKLRDWLFSRQRYWGEPIPIIHLEDGTIAVERKLPLILPELEDYKPSKDGKAPLSKASKWLEVKVGSKKGTREINTMPQWAGSSWYYARYIDPKNDKEIGDKKLLDHWLPVDVYVGGAEHAVLHLLYARFWHKFLHNQGIFKSSEPFKKLYHQGLILGTDGQKMSKSAGNAVSPDEIIEEFGADALRLYEMFKGPVDQSLPWSIQGPKAAKKFIDRFYRLFTDSQFKQLTTDKNNDKLDYVYNYTIKKCTQDYEMLHFNTGVSQIMIFVNALYEANSIPKKMLVDLAKLIAPICPHLGQECYSLICDNNELIDYTSWPKYKEEKISAKPITYAVQVNGKLRGTIEYKFDANDKELEELKEKAVKLESVKTYLENKEIIKIIVVKNKIISIVVK